MATANYLDLMSVAAQNAAKNQQKAKMTFQPKLAKNKPLTPKDMKLKEGVQKFLAQKSDEERRKKLEQERRKNHLLQLRSQDRKTSGKVRRMMKLTKSANKSCMADADDCLNEALAKQGEYQPDNDDYGYSSSFAEEMHKKMMERYKTIPVPNTSSKPKLNAEVPKIQSLGGQKHKHKEDISEPTKSQNFSTPSSKIKKPKPPPIMSYEDMLKLAEKKKEEPVVAKKIKLDKKEDETDFEFGRPMTAKEKANYLQEKAFREKIMAGGSTTQQVPTTDTNNNASKPSASEKSFKIPSKKSVPKPVVKEAPNFTNSPPQSVPSTSAKSNFQRPIIKQETPLPKPERKIPPSNDRDNGQKSFSNSSKRKPESSSEGCSIERKASKMGSSSSQFSRKQESLSEPKPKSNRPAPYTEQSSLKNKKAQYDSDVRRVPSQKSDVMRRSQHEDKMQRNRNHERPISRHPSEQPRPSFRKGPPPMPQYKGGRAIIDSDDEYDSEMDDFIDDSEVDQNSISAEIKSIFGYDRRRYADYSDDECEEASFAQQQIEERRSLKIGIKEDLEEQAREERELREKALRKKQMKMGIRNR